MTNKATLKALKTELGKTLGTAQQSLEQYLTASQSLDDWQGCCMRCVMISHGGR